VRRGTEPVTGPLVSSPGGRLLTGYSDGAFAIPSLPSRCHVRQPSDGAPVYVVDAP
jgi:hypothetical protein